MPDEGELQEMRRMDAHRADEIRNEARLMVRSALEEALAPLHYSIRDLERRLGDLERRPASAATPPTSAAAPGVGPPQALYVNPAAPAPEMRRMARSNPFAAAAPAEIAAAPVVVPARQVSVPQDVVASFDGSRRRRRITIFFILALLLTIGALLAAMIGSRLPSS